MLYTNIIWDFDGTLFNTYPGMVKAFQTALKDFGFEEEAGAIFNQMKISVGHAVNYYKDLYAIDEKVLTHLYKSYEKENEAKGAQPFPYAEEFCRRFKEQGGRNFIFTHRDETTHKYLEHYKMQDIFDEVLTKSSGLKKPGPEGFLYFIDKYNLNKEQVLVIGDRDIEIIGAKSAGIHSCLYNTGKVDWDVTPDYKIDSLKDLFELVSI